MIIPTSQMNRTALRESNMYRTAVPVARTKYASGQVQGTKTKHGRKRFSQDKVSIVISCH